jgi:mannose-1-phosphate guanylyltransferase / mannose-6-phosphate isomerase
MALSDKSIIPVILSGGSGARLWPLSRNEHPKQFLPLVGERTMLQQTVERLNQLPSIAAPMVVCNSAHRFLVAEQVRDCGIEPGPIILEPVPRNTAPAVAIAAMEATATGDDPYLLVLPADHHIQNPEALGQAVALACEGAMTGALMTFGIVPTRPETGYGYIAVGEPLLRKQAGEGVQPDPTYRVSRFVEKPDQETAQQYLDTGNYLWNSGMFLFRASRYLEELQKYEPAIHAACRQALDQASRNNGFIKLQEEHFGAAPENSIDYAVMERTSAAGVVALNAGWSDVGSWASLLEVNEQDDNGNVVLGDVILNDVNDSYVRSESRMVAAIGINGHVIVETTDAVLVAPKDRAQDVKALVSELRSKQRTEVDTHKRVMRPWGWYETIDHGDRYQVKRLTVKPGASLSLQKHHHRAEHWVVVQGMARVTRDKETFELNPNESTYIPKETLHRLANPGSEPLEVIEVQSGDYLGEDDIVRFDDDYGRTVNE